MQSQVPFALQVLPYYTTRHQRIEGVPPSIPGATAFLDDDDDGLKLRENHRLKARIPFVKTVGVAHAHI